MFALVAVRVFEMPCRWPVHITSIDADIVAGVGTYMRASFPRLLMFALLVCLVAGSYALPRSLLTLSLV